MNLQILFVILLVSSSSVYADIYKWKDTDGTIRYSDRPPTNAVPYESLGVKKSTATTPANPPENAGQAAKPSEKIGKQKTSSDADAGKRQQAAEDLKKKEQDKDAALKQKQENCTIARNNLQTYKLGGRITKINEKGEREYLSDADIASNLVQAQKDVDQYCDSN